MNVLTILILSRTGGGGQAHCVSHVCRNGGGSTGMDQAPDAVHKPQSVLRYSSTKEKEGAQQELVLSWRWTRPPFGPFGLLYWISVEQCCCTPACLWVHANMYVRVCVQLLLFVCA